MQKQEQIHELVKANPELRIRVESEFFEDDIGTLYARSAGGSMLRILAGSEQIVAENVKDVDVTTLRRVRNIATLGGD